MEPVRETMLATVEDNTVEQNEVDEHPTTDIQRKVKKTQKARKTIGYGKPRDSIILSNPIGQSSSHEVVPATTQRRKMTARKSIRSKKSQAKVMVQKENTATVSKVASENVQAANVTHERLSSPERNNAGQAISNQRDVLKINNTSPEMIKETNIEMDSTIISDTQKIEPQAQEMQNFPNTSTSFTSSHIKSDVIKRKKKKRSVFERMEEEAESFVMYNEHTGVMENEKSIHSKQRHRLRSSTSFSTVKDDEVASIPRKARRGASNILPTRTNEANSDVDHTIAIEKSVKHVQKENLRESDMNRNIRFSEQRNSSRSSKQQTKRFIKATKSAIDDNNNQSDVLEKATATTAEGDQMKTKTKTVKALSTRYHYNTNQANVSSASSQFATSSKKPRKRSKRKSHLQQTMAEGEVFVSHVENDSGASSDEILKQRRSYLRHSTSSNQTVRKESNVSKHLRTIPERASDSNYLVSSASSVEQARKPKKRSKAIIDSDDNVDADITGHNKEMINKRPPFPTAVNSTARARKRGTTVRSRSKPSSIHDITTSDKDDQLVDQTYPRKNLINKDITRNSTNGSGNLRFSDAVNQNQGTISTMNRETETSDSLITKSIVKFKSNKANKTSGQLEKDKSAASNSQTNIYLTAKDTSTLFSRPHQKVYHHSTQEDDTFLRTDQDVHLHNLNIVKRQCNYLTSPLMFGASLKHRYETLASEGSSFSSEQPLPESVINKVLKKYNKKLLCFNHERNELVEKMQEKAATILDQVSMTKATTSSKKYWDKISSELNYSIPSDFPVECAATQSQYQEYMQLASDIESLHEQRKQKQVTLKNIWHLVQGLDKLKTADDRYVAAKITNSCLAKEHFEKLASAVSDARTVAGVFVGGKEYLEPED
ncbi:unnamed protein product [Clavelina lepadiformis]|uniref:Uncharacterized protein n=1 Tax=Clavelina lepadiformis TaxID=159417 RepID=A0ABP0F854_CLALP